MHYSRSAIRQLQAAKLLNQNFKETGKNITGDGVKLCRRAKAHHSDNPDTAFVKVSTTKNNKRVANMVDVAHCGNAFLCSHCSGLKSLHMCDWINELLAPALKQHNLHVGLLTLTASHQYSENWSEYVENFYLAVRFFTKTIKRDLDKLGSIGRIRAMECPVGSNGLHVHIHDLLTYIPSANTAAFEKVILKKWKAALATVRKLRKAEGKPTSISCNSHGATFVAYGAFDITYIAKDPAAEVANHDTKTKSKKDLKSLFSKLDDYAKGDVKAGKEWIRAAEAIQRRDRWNVGHLAQKLGIPCPTDWKKPKDLTTIEEEAPTNLIQYPQSQHLVATSSRNDKLGIAIVQRSAISEIDNNKPGLTQKAVLSLCERTRAANIELLTQKNVEQLTKKLEKTKGKDKQFKLAKKQATRLNLEIDKYNEDLNNYLFAKPVALIPVLPMTVEEDLDFS